MGSGDMSEAEFTAFLQTVFDLSAKIHRRLDPTTYAWIGGTCRRCSPPAARIDSEPKNLCV